MGAQHPAPSKPTLLSTMVKPWSSSALSPGMAADALKVPLASQEVAWAPQEGHHREMPSSEAVQDA